jgi:peptide/nickel transport system substrate-binding protein
LLRRYRRAAHLTQEDLAERAKISKDTISALERGVSRAPHKDTIELLADALQLSPEERAQLEAAARGRLAPVQDATRDIPLHLVRTDEEQTEQSTQPESAPPQKPASLPVRRQRKRVALRLAVLLVLLVGTYSGLSHWQHLWPFGKDKANATATPGYVYAPPTHPGGTIIFSTTDFSFYQVWKNGTWNPWFIDATDELEMRDALWGQPYVISPSAALLPDELEEIPTLENREISQNGLTVIMHLRHDLRWSDGQPITADDFVYWLEVLLDAAIKDEVGFNSFGYTHIASHQVLDDYTLVLRYEQPYAPFLYYLPMAAPKHAWGNIPHQDLRKEIEVNLAPSVTSGPFKIESYNPDQSNITMVPNPYYKSTTLHKSVLDRLVYRTYPDPDALVAAFELGQTDYAEDFGRDAIFKLAGRKYVKTAELGYTLLDFNLTNPVLKDYQVRKAIEEAIDRCELIQTVFLLPCQSMRMDTLLPETSPAYDPTIKTYDFDLAGAREDMLIAGWNCASGTCIRDGKSFPMLRLLTTDDSVTRQQVTVLIKKDLEALGIPVTLNYYPPIVLFNSFNVSNSLASGKFDLALFANTFGIDNDAYFANFHSKEIPSADNPFGSNWERLDDQLVDHYLDLARITFDMTDQTRMYKALQQQLVAQVYVIPLYNAVNSTLVNPNIGNQQNTQWGPGNLWNVSDWFLIK